MTTDALLLCPALGLAAPDNSLTVILFRRLSLAGPDAVIPPPHPVASIAQRPVSEWRRSDVVVGCGVIQNNVRSLVVGSNRVEFIVSDAGRPGGRPDGPRSDRLGRRMCQWDIREFVRALSRPSGVCGISVWRPCDMTEQTDTRWALRRWCWNGVTVRPILAAFLSALGVT